MMSTSIVASFCLAAALSAGAHGTFGQGVPSSVPYVSGGIGEESRAELQAEADRYDLHVIFALRSGEYVSGAEVVLRDASGTSVLTTSADGPWLYANIAPGNYEMTATLGAQTLAKTFSVPIRGSREVVFRFTKE